MTVVLRFDIRVINFVIKEIQRKVTHASEYKHLILMNQWLNVNKKKHVVSGFGLIWGKFFKNESIQSKINQKKSIVATY